MKKLLFFGAMALMASASLTAKDADQLRIYINPGHGSWTGNDRPCQLVGHKAYDVNDPDTTNFFESNTNLRKGYGLLEKLRQMGLKFDPTLNQTGELHQIGAARDMSNNIVMSHVKAGPHEGDYRTENQLDLVCKPIYEKYSNGKEYAKLTAAEKAEIETKFTDEEKATVDHIKYLKTRLYLFNRSLGEIAAEVDANNFDMFISIHSNAATEGTTSNYPLYLYRGYDGKDGAKVAGSYEMAQTCWPHSYALEHMGWNNYSMTKTNLRGDLNFYKTTSTYGYLGALKHETPGFLVEGYFHTYQPARQRAMNWDVDYMEGYAYARGIAEYFGLKDEKGSIYGIVRDEHEKFVHKQYQPNPALDDVYLPLNGAKVVLKQGENIIAEYTTDNNYNGAYVFRDVDPGTYTIEISHPDYKAFEPFEVEVKAGATSCPKSKLENTAYQPPKINYVTYPDELTAGVQDEYNFTDKSKDVALEALAGKTIKRSIARGEIVYILALDGEGAATLLIYDVKEKAVVRELGTEGTSGAILPLSDIALTAEGVLVGINKTNQAYGGSKEVHAYKWANNAEDGLAEGNPEVWFSTNNGGNWSNAVTGETMAFAGTLDDGRMLYSAVTTAESKNLRLTNVTIANGTMASAHHMNHNSNANGNEVALGEYQLNISPAADNQFIITSSVIPAAEYVCAPAAAGVPAPVASMSAELQPFSFRTQLFKYAGHTYMVASVDAVASAAEGEEAPELPKAAGLKLLDITEGLDKAQEIGVAGATFAPAEYEGFTTMGQTIVKRDVEDNITGGHINLYVANANGVSHFTTENVKQPVYKTEFAYGLKTTESSENSGYELEYSISGDAVAAAIILTPVEEGETIEIPVEATKGAHTYSLSADQMESGKYNWSVNVTSKSNGVGGEVYADPSGLDARRGGVITITDPSVESFGYTVVGHGKAAGIDIYNPAGEKVGERLWKDHATFGGTNGGGNQSNPFRGNEREGKAVFATWGDAAYGVVVVDPLAKEEPFTMFKGTKQNSGSWMYEEKNLGGGNSGLCFVGTGENTKLYTFSEDHAGTENTIVRYDLGNAWEITEAPTQVGFKSFLANTNVDMIGYGNGMFVSQVRGAGNNVQGCPCFAYILNEEDWNTNPGMFQSSSIKELTQNNSGIAINKEGTIFAAGEPSRIDIFDVEWTEEGNPKMTLAYTIPTSKSVAWSHMRFDAAGNLHVYERENGGYHVYALVRKSPVVNTPSFIELTGHQSGVDNVAVDMEETEGAAEYWNLQGVKVNADNLTPGIYIRRQGAKTEKVVIR
ncbi:MAG: carboxypeptidase-like regulatory domain-containing protein [Muribaculaceae bacterium]|nr:carboxypeptidase-like regulatory domain-containing protein [Muribaculaceae bacterium]